jgi:hypothetical protein
MRHSLVNFLVPDQPQIFNFLETDYVLFFYRGPRAVPHVALHGLPQLRGIRQIANRHRAPAPMRYSDPGIVPFGKLSQ